jgi:hypothetical protein
VLGARNLLERPQFAFVEEAFFEEPALRDVAAAEVFQCVLEDLSAPNWELEWSLPQWLGVRFGLSSEVCRDLTLANVFGLAYLRVVDDWLDDETSFAQVTPRLATAFLRASTARFRRHLRARAGFWGRYRAALSRWMHATLASRARPSGERVPASQFPAELGAPLRITCAAVVSLAHQEAMQETLREAVDAYVSAAVLLDHAKDWREDLEANRPNRFLQEVLGATYAELPASEVGWRVIEAALDGRTHGAYAAEVERLCATARQLAERVACFGLACYLREFQREVGSFFDRKQLSLESTLDQAVQVLFGTQPVGRPPRAAVEEGQ